jgi:serine protease Do
MSETEREPCPRCGEPAALAGRVCPHCKGSLLVDVVLDAAPPQTRSRYQLARGLASLDPPPISFGAAQQAIGIPHSVLASGVTRDVARKVLRLIQDNGGRGRTLPTQETAAAPVAGGRVSSFVAVVCLLAVVGFAIYAWTWRLNRPDEGEIEMPLSAARATDQGPVLDTRELAARATPATVMLRCPDSIGSGFFVAEELVLTNAHVLCGNGGAIRAMFSNGREMAAQTVQQDDWLDLALVRVPGARATPLPLGDATTLRTGDKVVFIGTPRGLEFTVHEGIVSHTARNLLGLAYLQIDANVNSGNSGGPLLDRHGRVVGIVSARMDESEGLGFALPANYAYEGEGPMLVPPSRPAPDSDTWRRLMARVAEADRREVAQASSDSGRTALLALAPVPGRGLVAVVARRARTLPSSEPVTFVFRAADRILCRVSSVASDWQPAGSGLSGEGASSRYVQWLKKHGLQKEVFQGMATLDLQACPTEELPGAEVVLEGGDERADRVGI